MRRALCLLGMFLTVVGSALLMSTQVQGNVYQELGWQVKHPMGWVGDGNSLKDPASDKAIFITSKEATLQEVESFVKQEAQQSTLLQPVSKVKRDELEIYYITASKVHGKQFMGPMYTAGRTVRNSFNPMYLEDKQIEIRKAVFFDGVRQYLFASQGQVSREEFAQVIDSFKLKVIKQQIAAGDVTELSISAPGVVTKTVTKQQDRALIEGFVSAYNEAEICGQDSRKAYPVIITLTFKNGSKIEISGGAFDFLSVQQNNREFNVRGAKLQDFFVFK